MGVEMKAGEWRRKRDVDMGEEMWWIRGKCKTAYGKVEGRCSVEERKWMRRVTESWKEVGIER